MLAGLALLVAADRCGLLLAPARTERHRYHARTARVVQVIDGDTLEIDRFDPVRRTPTTRVRLWGVDCPEIERPRRAAEPLADEATRFTIGAVATGPVRLWLEPHRVRGTFGRVLAHVELDDGRCLNELLVDAGLARTDERWSHSRLDVYAAAERSARRTGRGVWASPRNALWPGVGSGYDTGVLPQAGSATRVHGGDLAHPKAETSRDQRKEGTGESDRPGGAGSARPIQGTDDPWPSPPRSRSTMRSA
jgi:endonuclease YncB( thermonuclease family)